MDETTELENLKGRVEHLEELLERLDIYLSNHLGIVRDSQAHREIKLTLGKVQWGERVIFPEKTKECIGCGKPTTEDFCKTCETNLNTLERILHREGLKLRLIKIDK